MEGAFGPPRDMTESYEIRFGPFVIDRLRQQLLHGSERIALRPKTWAVLLELVQRPGEVVSNEELLNRVWEGKAVTPEVASVSVRELRRALGDNRQQPCYIETLPRRGYRFVARLESSRLDEPTSFWRHREPTMVPGFVGRSRELAEIQGAFELALGGRRQVLFISGEAGIGKSSLLAAAVRQLEEPGKGFLLGRAQCVAEQREAFLPLLDMLVSLCQNDISGKTLRRLERFAPLWLWALPEVRAAGERPESMPDVGATPERLLRQLNQALEALSWDYPVVLILEDIHWADLGTVQFLRFLAERAPSARLLVVCTYRAADANVGQHPLSELRRVLLSRQRCRELVLEGLDAQEVHQFVHGRWPDLEAEGDFAAWLSQRTDGSPLFLHALVEQLLRDGLLTRCDGRWLLQHGFDRVGVPASVRELIGQHLSRLSKSGRALVEAASVVGVRFSASSVACALKRQVAETDSLLAALAERRLFIRRCGTTRWPDGTVSSAYEFVHSLYSEVIYRQLPGALAARWHGRVGRRLENAFKGRTQEVCFDLARHFTHAGDYRRAYRYQWQAAACGLQRQALAEAYRHLLAARASIEQLHPRAVSGADSVAIGCALGATSVALHGYAARTAVEAYEWALQRAGSGTTRARVIASMGLCTALMASGALDKAHAVARKIEYLRVNGRLPKLLSATAMNPLGQVWFYRGNHRRARQRFSQELALLRRCQPAIDSPPLGGLLWIDPFVACSNLFAISLVLGNRADRGLALMEESLGRARTLGHPFTFISALTHAALVHFVCENWEMQQTCAREALELATECGFPFWISTAGILLGHALALSGKRAEGLALLERSLEAWTAAGTQLGRPLYHAMLAEAYLSGNEPERALDVVQAYLDPAGASEERVHEPYLFGVVAKAEWKLGRKKQTHIWFTRAVDVAIRQQAPYWIRRCSTQLEPRSGR